MSETTTEWGVQWVQTIDGDGYEACIDRAHAERLVRQYPRNGLLVWRTVIVTVSPWIEVQA